MTILAQTIFRTQLFNGHDEVDIVNKFKITTIVVSITTFAIAVLLVLLVANLHRLRRTSIFRKWVGRMQRLGSTVEKEANNPAEEQTAASEEQVQTTGLQTLRRRFQRTSKESEKGKENP